MSNGDPPPTSAAPYIIICSRRTQASGTKDPIGKIIAASRCAAELCAFIEANNTIQPGDFAAVSAFQHEMMDNMHSWSKDEAVAKVEEMFALLDDLEDKFE